MARAKEQRVGYLPGETPDGVEAIVSVSKIGRDYRIGYGHGSHLCHPSVRNIEGVKREALLVFDVRNTVFEYV
jgi:hypothetical protein